MIKTWKAILIGAIVLIAAVFGSYKLGYNNGRANTISDFVRHVPFGDSKYVRQSYRGYEGGNLPPNFEPVPSQRGAEDESDSLPPDYEPAPSQRNSYN